jgi:hypothetical protein
VRLKRQCRITFGTAEKRDELASLHVPPVFPSEWGAPFTTARFARHRTCLRFGPRPLVQEFTSSGSRQGNNAIIPQAWLLFIGRSTAKMGSDGQGTYRAH